MHRQAYCDTDGVTANLIPALARVHGFNMDDYPPGVYDLEVAMKKPLKALWGHPDVLGAKFWASIERTPWADDLVALLEQFFEGRVILMSQPVRDTASLDGKAQWFRRWYPKRPFLIGPAKHHIGHEGGVLIDDNEKNCAEWEKAGGTAILFPALWNRLHGLRNTNLVEYVRQELDKLA